MAEIKKLVLDSGLLAPALAGDKKVTLWKCRKEAHDLKKGEIVLGVFEEKFETVHVLLKITESTKKKKFKDVTDEEAQSYGYKSAEDLFFELKNRYYTDLKKEDTLAIVSFEPMRTNGLIILCYPVGFYSTLRNSL